MKKVGIESFILEKLKAEMMHARIIIMIFFPIFAIAQAPQKINFQSILRNSSGEVIGNKSVSLKITILSESINGSSVYSETHAKTTDASGLISLQIGNGTVISGIFANIDWGGASHFIKLEADFSGGSSYVVLGTQELMSVPYAMYASKTDTSALNLTSRLATKLSGTDTASLSNRIDDKLNRLDFPTGTNTGNILYWNGTNWVNLAPGQNGQALFLVNGIPTWSDAASATVPSAPTGVVATAGNSSASVAFVAPTNDGGSALTGYTVTSNPGNISVSGTTSPINVTGLTNGTAYTFTVVATNSVGSSVASAASTAVTPSTVPSAPTSVVATAGNSSASVAFVAPTNNGGSALTGYTVTSNPNGITAFGSTSPINVTGLTNGTAYTFTVVATNAVGSSVSSSSSTAVTPMVCPTSTITDIDGNIYNTVFIDNQCWMSENLKTSRYRNGALIPIVTDNAEWISLTTGGRSWYNNDSTTYENPYGNLYNWYVVADSRGLCPMGWHAPTDVEWTTLSVILGGATIAGGKMKSTGTTYWNSPNTSATNESGFSVLPGGYRVNDVSFNLVSGYAFIWSATELDNGFAWNSVLYYNTSNVGKDINRKSVGASVRCLRD